MAVRCRGEVPRWCSRGLRPWGKSACQVDAVVLILSSVSLFLFLFKEKKFLKTFGASSVSRLSGRDENCWPGWMESVFFVALMFSVLFREVLLVSFGCGNKPDSG